MAPNSLFAVLLRSPWWVSFVIVVLTALASRALLPAPYVAFGVMGGFPFLVIGCIAAHRQLQAPGDGEVARTTAALAAMGWNDFSTLLERAYCAQGYTVRRVQGHGADLQLVKAGSTTVVSAKRWKAGNQGVEGVRALAQARSALDASHCTYVALVALGHTARQFANENQVDVLTGPELAALVRKVPARPPA
jgi:restriction system protein